MKLLNFGSINIDNCYRVKEFVRAGETISAEAVERHAGGKGFNQSVALARAGAEVYHAGCIGQDGLFLREMLAREGVKTELIRVAELPTGNAIIQVNSRGNNCILLYSGANGCVTEEYADRVLESFGPGDVLLLQNEISCLPYIIQTAVRKGMRIAWNPSPMNDGIRLPMLQAASWLFVNQVEAAEITGIEDREAGMEALIKLLPQTAILMTLGEDGAVYKDGSGLFRHGIYPVDTVDTTGAGDTFTGFFLASLLRGESAGRALETASKAAALSVTRPGAAESIPTREELSAFRF